MSATVVLQRASRARWLARRRKGITATDAPAILGLSPWKTPLGVWLDKVQPGDDKPPSYAMTRGRVLEDALAAEYARQTGHIVERPPLLLAHPEYPTMLASLDRLAHTPDTTYLLEIKNENDRDRAREWWDGDTPDQYAVQVLWQLAVTGLDEGIIFADVQGRLETRTIRRDLEWEATAIPGLLAWWADYVETRTPPPLHEFRDYGLLSRVWVPDPALEAYADDATLGALDALVRLREVAQERDHTITGLRSQVRAYMGPAGVLRHPETGKKLARVDKRGAMTVTHTPTVKGVPA